MTERSELATLLRWAPDVLVTIAVLLVALTVSSVNAQTVRPLAKATLEGEVAPGTGGATFTAFDEPFVNINGQIVFAATYTGGGGVFLSTQGVLSAVVVSGQAIPGIGAVTLNDAFSVDGPALNNSGTVVFATRGSNTPAVVQKKALGTLTVLAKAGDPAPGTGGVFIAFDDMSLNNNDDVAFIATYMADIPKTGVFLKPNGGALVKIVADGDLLPGGCTFKTGGNLGDIDGPWMNDLQVVAFKIDGPCGGDVNGFDTVLVKQPGQPLATFVAEGDPAPAFLGGGTFGGITLGRPGLNNANTLVFRTNGGDDTAAIITKTLGQSPVLCLKDLSPAPGTSGTFDGLAENAAINQAGLVFVQADVVGDPTVTAGIFTCQAGLVFAAALQGDPIPGTTSTFSADIEEGSVGDNGCVVFLHESTPQGVFTCGAEAIPTLSEWAMILLALLLAGGAVGHIRRQRALAA